MAKYNFSITEFGKKFEVTGCDSFDEAIIKVEKGMYEYKLAQELKKENQSQKQSIATPTPSLSVPSTDNNSLHTNDLNIAASELVNIEEKTI